MEIYIGGVDKAAFAETDGISYSIYFSGCSIRCPDCHNKEMWEMESGTLTKIDDLIADVESNSELIDNVCILGGEPTDQLAGLQELLRGLRRLNIPIWLYTGRELEQVKRLDITQYCDTIKCGPYNTDYGKDETTGLASNNQHFVKSNGGTHDAN